MKKSVLMAFGAALLAPALTLAQVVVTNGTPQTGYIDTWIGKAVGWLSSAITIIMVLMTLWFLFGVFKYIAEKDASKLKERRTFMLNGLIGLFVAVSVWGIISIAGNVFGTKNSSAPSLACPPGTKLGAVGTTDEGRCVIPRP